MVEKISPAVLHRQLCSGQEIALVDLREQGVFGIRHILRAVNIPLSYLELRYRRLIPRMTTPIVLCDAGEGLTDRAADTLAFAGWTNLSILDGGIDAWEGAGYPLFSGVNVPSKAFGEYIETHFGTPHISAPDLAARLESGEKLAILDSRPYAEFHRMSIPGGIDMPGAELVHRVKEIVPDPQTPIIVNCAGRTRSIIGAQSLINAGVPNPVHALENGTMGWMLAGMDCAEGETDVAASPGPQANAWAAQATARVAKRFGVQKVTLDTVRTWQGDPNRTTFLLDVRAKDEFEEGHLEGAAHAPGGQLVQATDEYVGTINARIVLVDDTETRAVMTASWLIQMGWPDVSIVDGGLKSASQQGESLETGPAHEKICELDLLPIGLVEPSDLMGMDDVPLINFTSSLRHRKRHPKGARFAIRARAMQDLGPVCSSRQLIFTGDDMRLATLAAQDLSRVGIHRVRLLNGGNAAWEATGGAMASGMNDPLSAEDDVFHKPYDLELNKDAMQAYIDWEVALVPQVEREGTLKWPHFPA